MLPKHFLKRRLSFPHGRPKLDVRSSFFSTSKINLASAFVSNSNIHHSSKKLNQSFRLYSRSTLSMKLKAGIVGLPNVGKSTLFNALTGGATAQAANFPFCTIEPNVGIVEVPDERLQKLGDLNDSEKVIPAVLEFVDIPGLVKGASAGEGLGNKFLANIRECDMIVQVVRCFEDD